MHFALQYKQMLVYYPSPQPLLSQKNGYGGFLALDEKLVR